MAGGKQSTEKEIEASAAEAWKLIGTLQLPKVLQEALPTAISKLEVLEGDGGVGTIILIVYNPGVVPGLTSYKEKYTVVDDVKRVKETEAVEGGYLNLGFTLYLTRFEVIEKQDSSSCVIRCTIEYQLKQDLGDKEVEAAKQIVSIAPLVQFLEFAAANYLKK